MKSSKMDAKRRLPDGMLTDDATLYVDAWADFAEPIERALGWRMASFDPGVTFDVQGGEQVSMSVNAVSLLRVCLLERDEAMLRIQAVEAALGHAKLVTMSECGGRQDAG